jgi:hypothetical protein
VWSLHGRMVVELRDLVRCELRDGDPSVVLDHELPAAVRRHVLEDHLLPLVLAREGRLVLHGGVVGDRGRGVVLQGGSGAGKSTLTVHLGRQGWWVGGDDAAVVGEGHPPTVRATHPSVRLLPDAAALLGVDAATTTPVAGKLRLPPAGDAPLGASLPLAAVVELHPVPATEPAGVDVLRGVAAHVALLSCSFHVDRTDTERMAVLVSQLGRVAREVTVARLRVPRGTAGLVAEQHALSALLDAAVPG